MTATECPTEHQLRDLSLGRLDSVQSNDLLSHVNSCDVCQSNIETFDDGEDSLIMSLRTPGALDKYQDEANCELALIRALGALEQGDAMDFDRATPHELPIGLPRQFGEYELVRPLGRGGMGSVYLARHTKLGREVALKVLAHHRLGDSRVRERFEIEMQAIGRLSHPNVVTAHDARDVAGTAVLVTEFIDGFDLGQLLHRVGPLKLANACEIIRQVAVALEYTHGQGFVHRDVKPSNIMLGRAGEVKLLDLGLARFQFGDADKPDMTGTGQAMGTADYIAPEQVTDSRNVDVRADVYSLGCTLFKLLTGVAPFSGETYNTSFAKMTAHVSSPAPSLSDHLPDTPQELVKLVDSMLAKSPVERPQTPGEVAERLQPFVNGQFGDVDLVHLVEASRNVNSKATANVRRGSSTPATSQPQKPRTFFRRQVPVGLLVATGFATMAIGFVMGVIVNIKYPDGTIVTHVVPDGGKIEIVSDEPADIERPSESADKPKANLPNPASVTANSFDVSDVTDMPVFFGIVSLAALENIPLPSMNPNGAPVVQDNGIWVRVDQGLNVPSVELKSGDYTFLELNPHSIIPWSQLFGDLSAQSDGMSIQLTFDNELVARMRRFTNANLKRQLAIVVNGKVIAAPEISASISDRAEVTGKFTREDMLFFMKAISGLTGLKELPRIPDHQLDHLGELGNVGASSDPNDAAASILERLHGIWHVTSATDSGRPMATDLTVLMAFHDKRHLFFDGKNVEQSHRIVVESRYGSGQNVVGSTFHADLVPVDRGDTKLGLLQFQHDGTLKFCWNESGDDRPTAFESKPDSPNDVLLILKQLSSEVPMSQEAIRKLLTGGAKRELIEAINAINTAAMIDDAK